VQRLNDDLLLTASDVVNHLECEHLTVLDLRHLVEKLEKTAEDPTNELLQRKGEAWERTYLERLRAEHGTVVEICRDLNYRQAAHATREAMASGAPIVYQGVLTEPGYLGRADFLRRIPGPSVFGDWAYEVLDTKLSKRAKAGHVLQLCFYTWLTGRMQQADAPYMHVVLGDGSTATFRYADYSRYFHRVRRRLAEAAANPRTDTYPHPCDKCPQCHWRDRCEQQRVDDDHLWQVANIARTQIHKLQAAGLSTMTALAAAPADTHVPKLAPETLARVRAQASMQVRGRTEGAPCFDLKAREPGRGLLKLPPPSPGDLYFDMEGDPLADDGLEYLFGVTWREGEQLKFRAFWGHTPAEEKRAFEAFVDFVMERRRRWPELHVYHYADYERHALERLMSLHGTREHEVDTLFKERRLVDLYRVVAEALVASTDSYSIKQIERFYRGARRGEVKDAGASIVQYERWRQTGDPQLLHDIELYNRDDCESTAQLHAWLCSIRPDDCDWRATGEAGAAEQAGEAPDADTAGDEDPQRAAARRAREQLKAALVAGLPPDPADWSDAQRVRHLSQCLIDFHQRCDKPAWWKIFSCADLSVEELKEDIECVGGMTRVAVRAPTGRGRLPTWVYEYPEQEFKLAAPKAATRADTHATLKVLEIDEARRRMVLRPSEHALEPDPVLLSIGPGKPIDTDVLRDAVARFGQSLCDVGGRYRAIEDLLNKTPPRLRGHAAGTPLVASRPAPLAQISAAVAALDDSYLFIQGPPGAGKTWTGSHVIVDLLQSGKRVGVTSNSHKAINNLLASVVEVCQARGFEPCAVKKTSRLNPDSTFDGPLIENVPLAEDALIEGNRLVAGTAWLFAEPDAEQAFDYLFVDEAGQVSLGHLVAMGLAARNLVLLGDQMQLPQPIQGVHPGRSGESVLDYLLDGQAVIAPERGIFLANSYRMHPDVCRFISDAVYDGQLESAPGRDRQGLVFAGGAPPTLPPTGIRFVPVAHDGCSQRSEEEAAVVRRLVEQLLGQSWRDHEDRIAPLALDDVLVVAPYNLQVNLLKQRLPAGARVGTVDKFQGQEAPVVLVSLATSSGDYLPRDIEFLYSKHRLNVALSRAKCLAVLIASPKLLDVQCRTAEEIRLVNTLCWVEEYSGALHGR
jgi:uncharacterized protein